VIEKIERNDLAKKVLSWITYTVRPLSTAELCCALAVESEQPELDPENFPEFEDLVSVCAGLVVYDQQRDAVRLVHYTAQKYLETISTTWSPTPQLLVTKTCIGYLSFDAFKSGDCKEDELKARLGAHKLLDYAAKHWGDHARVVESDVLDLITEFPIHEGLRLCSAQVQEDESHTMFQDDPNFAQTTVLHTAAKFGLLEIARHILFTSKKNIVPAIDARDGGDRTPLMFAARYGHSSMVEWF
jgi:hypothetical protein